MNIKSVWMVIFTNTANRQAAKLSEKVLLRLRLLHMDLSIMGPAAISWPNYGKLQGGTRDKRHCHLQKGKPTYVCCWELVDKKRKIIEVYYVGTHEKAPY